MPDIVEPKKTRAVLMRIHGKIAEASNSTVKSEK